jgi:hypothetical protein
MLRGGFFMTATLQNFCSLCQQDFCQQTVQCLDMGDSNDRLRLARERAGFTSARQAALRYGWVVSTYASHENGQTPVPQKAAEKYAEKFKVSVASILTGEVPLDQDSDDAELIRLLQLADPELKKAVALLLKSRKPGAPPTQSHELRGRRPSSRK